jgi:hypothetical protein
MDGLAAIKLVKSVRLFSIWFNNAYKEKYPPKECPINDRLVFIVR